MQEQLQESDQLETLPKVNFNDLAQNVFSEKNGKIYFGGEEIRPEILSVFKDQARNLKTMELYESIIATLKDEAAKVAVIRSNNWDDIQYSKALWHVAFVLENIVYSLTKTK